MSAFIMCFAIFLLSFFAGFSRAQYVANGEGRIEKCAKCFFMSGAMPFGLTLPQFSGGGSDPRCGKWRDGIQTSDYETCGDPNEGESNACLYLNMTIKIKNIVTEILNNASQAIENINNITNVIGGIISNPATLVPAIPTVPTFPGGGGRLFKRQVRVPVPAAISNVVNQFSIPMNSGPNSDGSYSYKIWFKGCVKLSILETLTGSNCRLDPDLNDIRFFSQQALLQPLTDLITAMNSGISGFTGINNKIDGLCYFSTKDMTKQIWKAMLHYDPSTMQKLFGG